jgi:hypothetical protein
MSRHSRLPFAPSACALWLASAAVGLACTPKPASGDATTRATAEASSVASDEAETAAPAPSRPLDGPLASAWSCDVFGNRFTVALLGDRLVRVDAQGYVRTEPVTVDPDDPNAYRIEDLRRGTTDLTIRGAEEGIEVEMFGRTFSCTERGELPSLHLGPCGDEGELLTIAEGLLELDMQADEGLVFWLLSQCDGVGQRTSELLRALDEHASTDHLRLIHEAALDSTSVVEQVCGAPFTTWSERLMPVSNEEATRLLWEGCGFDARTGIAAEDVARRAHWTEVVRLALVGDLLPTDGPSAAFVDALIHNRFGADPSRVAALGLESLAQGPTPTDANDDPYMACAREQRSHRFAAMAAGPIELRLGPSPTTRPFEGSLDRMEAVCAVLEERGWTDLEGSDCYELEAGARDPAADPAEIDEIATVANSLAGSAGLLGALAGSEETENAARPSAFDVQRMGAVATLEWPEFPSARPTPSRNVTFDVHFEGWRAQVLWDCEGLPTDIRIDAPGASEDALQRAVQTRLYEAWQAELRPDPASHDVSEWGGAFHEGNPEEQPFGSHRSGVVGEFHVTMASRPHRFGSQVWLKLRRVDGGQRP